MSNSPEDKRKVLTGIFTAWALSLFFIGGGYWMSQTHDSFGDHSTPEILAMTLLPPAISLALGIGWAARTRHFDSHIDGSAPQSGSSLDLTLRYTRNTEEQILLFLLMSFGLLGTMPEFAKAILPVLGLWFLIARIIFWIGYRQEPVKRAVGFAATFHPTMFFLLIAGVGLFRIF